MSIEFYIEFIRSLVPDAEEVFTKGNCFGFAALLEDRFPGGEIYTDENHAVYKHGGRYFDITGEVALPREATKLRAKGHIAAMELIKPKYERER